MGAIVVAVIVLNVWDTPGLLFLCAAALVFIALLQAVSSSVDKATPKDDLTKSSSDS